MCKIKQIVPNCTINYRRDACMWILISISLMSCLKPLQAAQLQTVAEQARGATKGLQNSSADNARTTTTTARAAIKSTTSQPIVNEALTAAADAEAAAADDVVVGEPPQQQQLRPPMPNDALGQGAIEAKTSAATSTNKYALTADALSPQCTALSTDPSQDELQCACRSDAVEKCCRAKSEIRAVAGEPNYKSVNLTWEVEFVPLANDGSSANEAIRGGVAVTNELEPQPPTAFQIFYCELQTFGPQRCRVRLVNGTTVTVADAVAANATAHDEGTMTTTTAHDVRHFSALIDNLRMATRYTFHIRPQQQPGRRASGRHIDSARAEFANEIESDFRHGELHGGQTIVIPTKGFAAHATQCLPHASEIEVETGPYFAGRIVVDGGNCGIKGDPEDAAEKYTMRIDHKLCGSMVKPETNTVETFITVQENLGIFTHSTRRYQSGMQTVRASFTVPGKNGLAAPIEEPNDPFEPDDQRIGRDMRRMRFVDKTHLVLKDSTLNLNEVASASAQEQVQQPMAEARQAAEESAEVQELPPDDALPSAAQQHDNADLSASDMQVLHTKYAKLVLNQAEQSDNNNNNYNYNENSNSNHNVDVDVDANWYEAKSMPVAAQHSDDDDVYIATLRYITANLGSLLVTVSISVIIISICIIVAQRHIQRVQRLRMKSSLSSSSSSTSSSSSSFPPSFSSSSYAAASSCGLSKLPPQLPRKTLPRALQQQSHYQCSL